MWSERMEDGEKEDNFKRVESKTGEKEKREEKRIRKDEERRNGER